MTGKALTTRLFSNFHNSMYTGAMEPFGLNGVCPGGGVLVGRFLGNVNDIELSRAEEPVYAHWTVTIAGAD
jgi:hypothetical protein